MSDELAPPPRHIVIAEDDPAMRSFLTRALEQAGYGVRAYGDGLSAFDDLSDLAKPVDLLLTDIVMPGVDGIELALRATSIRPDLKVMYITGFATVTRDRIAGGAPDTQVLAKPLHLGQLIDEVARVLSAR
jgi:two-component system, cell cycle response regulator CpdR